MTKKKKHRRPVLQQGGDEEQEEIVALEAIYGDDFTAHTHGDGFSIAIGTSSATPASTQNHFVELVSAHQFTNRLRADSA